MGCAIGIGVGIRRQWKTASGAVAPVPPAVKGLVGAWKGYGRSNDEDASTRDILYDYSGNGHDIELKNFAFAGMRGWGGEYDDFSTFYAVPAAGDEANTTCEDKKLTVNVISPPGNSISDSVLYFTTEYNRYFKGRVRLSGLNDNKYYVASITFINTNNNIKFILDKDGDYAIDFRNTDSALRVYVDYTSNFNTGMGEIPLSQPITLEIIPWYNGALVSDGVDDHGWCGGFPWTEDFTVVAIRKNLVSSDYGYLICCENGTNTPFGFEGQFNRSYGTANTINERPPLFSWMTKTSYNGAPIKTGWPIENHPASFSMYLFSNTETTYGAYALYDLRIYDHSLTEDELRIVRDEMMAEYEANVNPLGSVHYIADWDAKDRSNDEDADAREEWADKVGGSIIKLSNYDFGGKSGWGEYPYNFLNILEANWKADITSHRLSIHSANESITSRIYQNVLGRERFTCRIKISGLSKGVSAGQVNSFAIYSVNTRPADFITSADGIYDVDVPFAENDDNILLYLKPTVPSVDTTLDEPVVVEMLPTIAGVLASDGVDDYGEIPSSKDYLNLSEVNTMLCFARIPRNGVRNAYAVFTTLNYPSLIRLWASVDFDGLPNVGSPTKSGSVMTNMYALTRDVEYDDNTTSLELASNTSGITRHYSVCTIQRIVLIRENIKEDIDFLKWKVEKEYRDWCKENGYDPTPMLTIPEAI